MCSVHELKCNMGRYRLSPIREVYIPLGGTNMPFHIHFHGGNPCSRYEGYEKRNGTYGKNKQRYISPFVVHSLIPSPIPKGTAMKVSG